MLTRHPQPSLDLGRASGQSYQPGREILHKWIGTQDDVAEGAAMVACESVVGTTRPCKTDHHGDNRERGKRRRLTVNGRRQRRLFGLRSITMQGVLLCSGRGTRGGI